MDCGGEPRMDELLPFSRMKDTSILGGEGVDDVEEKSMGLPHDTMDVDVVDSSSLKAATLRCLVDEVSDIDGAGLDAGEELTIDSSLTKV